MELTALVGYYTMVAMTLNAHEIPLPEGVQPAFPLPQRDMAVNAGWDCHAHVFGPYDRFRSPRIAAIRRPKLRPRRTMRY